MAYTSVIPVHRLDRSIEYVKDKEKTTQKADSLEAAIDYAMNRTKTEQAVFEDTIGCTNENAYADMVATKKRFHKMGGVEGYHLVQSFAEGEVTPELAHLIGQELADRLLKGQYEVVITTHLNTRHYHNHIVWNSVSMADGRKYHSNAKSYYTEIRKISDELCRKYGLSIIESNQKKSIPYVQWKAEQEGKPSYHSMVKADVDEAIRKARTEKQFFFYLREKGYSFKFGKDITIRPEGRERGLKLKRNFGENYSLEAIRVRILEENELPAEKKISVGKYYRIQVSGNFKQTRKIRGLRGLYLHYCYLLGILPKNRLSISAKQVHVLFREDLLKLNTISKETKLLCHYHIDTAEQLFLLKESLQKKMEQCAEERKYLRYKIRADRPEEEIEEMKEQIKVLTEKIGMLRKKTALCDGIAARSKVIEEKFKTVREEKEKKEEQSHEHIRRSR